MAVESATYIGQLNSAYPAGGEPIAQGDDHLRLIKSALQNSFPSLNAALTAAWLPFTPVGPITATNVQAAIAELAVEGVPLASAIDATTDLNTFVTAGFTGKIHGGAAGSRPANHPDGQSAAAAGNHVTNYYFLQVLQYSTNVLQVAYPYLSGADTTLVLIKYRMLGGGVWSAWNELPRQEDVDGKVPFTGGTLTGQLNGITPAAAANLTRKDYVDSADALRVARSGDSMTGMLSFRGATRPLSVQSTNDLNNWVEYLRAAGSTLGITGTGGGGASSTGISADFVIRAAANRMILESANVISCSQPIAPFTDGAVSCGSAGARWSAVYAVSGTINTSDARQKTPVREFTANELSAAKALAKEIGFFKWLRTEKGPGVRDHCGITVQKVIEIMEANGLDAFNYAFVCHDFTPETSRTLEEGDVIVEPAVDCYSLRPDQLSNFIMRGMEERLAALEASK